MTAKEIDKLERTIVEEVYMKHQVILSGVGIYSTNEGDDVSREISGNIRNLITKHPDVVQMHGLYIDIEKRSIVFDIIITFDCIDREKECETIRQEVAEMYPEYNVYITLDVDVSD